MEHTDRDQRGGSGGLYEEGEKEKRAQNTYIYTAHGHRQQSGEGQGRENSGWMEVGKGTGK